MDQIKPEQVTPTELVVEAVELARKKAELHTGDLLIRGMLAGALLGIATSLAFVAVAQGVPALVGAIIFPVGFVMLVLLGQELATGNFALLPMGMMAAMFGGLGCSAIGRGFMSGTWPAACSMLRCSICR